MCGRENGKGNVRETALKQVSAICCAWAVKACVRAVDAVSDRPIARRLRAGSGDRWGRSLLVASPCSGFPVSGR